MPTPKVIASAADRASVSPFKGIVRPVVLSAVFFMLLTGIAYPVATTVLGTAFFPSQAQGSVILKDGQPVASRQIGQHFTRADYFHGRPSATVGVDPADPSATVAQPYNAAASAASNQGVLSQNLIDAVTERTKAYRRINGLADDAPVPVDAVTASASGLDPHVSVANARLQAPRVAKARAMPLDQVLALVDQYTSQRQFGLLGDPRVHVLELNLALDMAASPRPAAH
ncbi:potassium-transporting ATPase subunit KdpC [Alcaligenes sp. SDU_A2]|uniref:potassium-transporting ATPase subunit KdpC n=1 Tax=Alcaligenes sp. SDU_A2 TaxID=3136634 RepID=UPI00311F391C